MAQRKKSKPKTQTSEVNGIVLLDRLRQMGVNVPGSRRPQSSIAKGETGKPKFAAPKPSISGQSSQRRKRNRKKAQENQKYYLDKAKASGKAWHIHVKSQDQYSEFVLITPAMAQLLLDEYNPDNRRLRENVVQAYCRDLKSGKWIDTGESVEIDENDFLYNGQHRLTAVVRTGIPCVLWVTFRCCVEARYAVDQNAKRDVTDKINQVLENKAGNKTGSIARGMMRGLTNTKDSFTHLEIIEFTAMYGNIIEWAAKSLRHCNRRDIQAAVAKAALWYGVEQIQPFADRLNGLVFTGRDDPAKRLYQRIYIQKCRDGLKVYKLTLSALEHFLAGRTVANLREREQDVFDWEPGWKIPSKSKK